MYSGVGRSVCIGIICLLSISPNITDSPRNSWWRKLKVKTPKYIYFFIYLCWILYMMENSIFSSLCAWQMEKWKHNKQNILWYCSTLDRDRIIELFYAALLVVPEVLFSVLLVWSSGSMFLILCRHKQRVQCIHSIKFYPSSCPESRVTQRILVLVCTFVTFHTLSSLLNAYIALSSALN